MKIRRIDVDEWPAARAARLAALADSAPGLFSVTYPEALEWADEQWRRWTAGRAVFVAESADAPVGLAAGLPTVDPPEMTSMWTAPSARGTGVSDRLVQTVVGWVRASARRELRLWVLGDNRYARNLYLRNGFAPTGRTRPCSPTDPRPEHQMRLLL
ncbi:GNAT family N-acetyltransferase [Nocardia brevicatena]|uniref:GNAT family N-acetyltransferase n=1 Tax=Nocardia brevicatena TaxID=37327 RepID=UPI0006876E2D|nr:GNAT family N-acetyltransferase [Nocardia brevicatena]